MFTTALTAAFFAFSAISGASAHGHHPINVARGMKVVRQDAQAPFSAAKFPDVQKALEGNTRFRETSDRPLFQSLVDDGQKPPFMMISCSDSRAPEATIFDSAPGTFFMERNIANQYKPGDENAQSVMAYGITVLGVQHVVVLGHYGCGGVAASIASAPKTKIDVATHIVQTWIGDIRSLYLQSNRTEIVEMREKNLAIEATGEAVGEPDIKEPGFRALVEENVKQQVKRITDSSVISNLNDRLSAESSTGSEEKKEKRAEEAAPLIPVFVHGWVYDLESGEIIDLNVSTGPKGFEDFVPGATEGAKEEGAAKDEEAKKEEEAKKDEEAKKEDEAKKEEASKGEAEKEEPVKEDEADKKEELVADKEEEKTEAVETPANAAQNPVATTPDPLVKEIGHSSIPAKRSTMLAKLRRSLPQQRSYGKRFSRQI